MANFTDEQKKALALAIHNGDEFFVLDGVAYYGCKEDERKAYAAHIDHIGGVDGTFAEWCATECLPVGDYDEDGDYRVLTDEEADEAAAEYIGESLWAFNSSFLAGVTGVDEEVFKAIAANDRCEDNNEAIRRLVGDDYESLVEQAISADGRGHFLNTYDGEENEINLFEVTGQNEYLYVYRIN